MRYRSPLCPQDAAHGPLLDWPTSIAAFYCPHVSHVGGRFYRTDLLPSAPGPHRDNRYVAVGDRKGAGSV